jgi:Family of unknown function (DUF5759)
MISAGVIAERERSRNNIRKETYKSILEGFSRKVKAAAERREKHATLQVPPMVLGFPMYPYDEALVYLRRQLILAGYQVRQGLETGQYIVTWDRPAGARPERRSGGSAARATETEPGDELFYGLANMQKVAAKLRAK